MTRFKGLAAVLVLVESNRIAALLESGRLAQTEAALLGLLAELGEGHDTQRITTLCRLARCLQASGRPAWAVERAPNSTSKSASWSNRSSADSADASVFAELLDALNVDDDGRERSHSP